MKQEIKPGAVVTFVLEDMFHGWSVPKEMTVVAFDPQKGLRLEDGEGSITCCTPGSMMFNLICEAITNRVNHYVAYLDYFEGCYDNVNEICQL